MRNQRQVVDYALQRRALLAAVRSGRVGSGEACDASPYLLRAAKFHGRPGELPCPVCRQEPLTLVSWVYGDELKHVSGSARSPEELARSGLVTNPAAPSVARRRAGRPRRRAASDPRLPPARRPVVSASPRRAGVR